MDTPGTLGNALVDAVEAVSEGRAEHLVLLRALHSPAGAYGHTAEVRADGIDQWRSPYGLHPVALAAQWWTRYQHLHRSGSREQMAVVARQARANGLARGGGYWAQRDAPPLADADYLSAPLVSTPLSVLDCDLPVQVASAFVLSSGALARSLRQSPAHVLAAVRSPTGSTYGLTSWCLEPVRTEAGAMGAALWSAAGVRPRDVDVAELYDGFSIFVVGWLEGLGLAPTGTGFDFLQDGRTARTGALPVNPSGGSLGNGRLHGAEQLSDGVFQVTGRAGACQVSGASTAVVAVGPPSSMAGAVVLAAD
jgi:acetyl-CoA acetyltransferase